MSMALLSGRPLVVKTDVRHAGLQRARHDLLRQAKSGIHALKSRCDLSKTVRGVGAVRKNRACGRMAVSASVQVGEESQSRKSGGDTVGDGKMIHNASAQHNGGGAGGNGPDDGSGGGDGEPILYQQRWLQLFYLAGLALLSDWVCFSVAATPGTWDSIFHRDATVLVDVFLFTNVLFCFLEPAIVRRAGLRNVVVGAAAVMTAGCALRSGLEFNDFIPFSPVMPAYTEEVIGTILVGAAQPFFQCTPTLLSAVWFGRDERALATSIAINANQIGIATSFLVGGSMAATGGTEGLNGYFSLITLLSILLTAGAFVQFEEAPPTPPSASAAQMIASEKANARYNEDGSRDYSHEPNFPTVAWKLLRTKGFIQPLVAFVASIGVSNMISTFIEPTLIRSGVADQESIGIAGAGFQLAIMFGSIVLGSYVDVSKKYKSVTMALLLISLGLLLPLGVAADLDNRIVLATIIALGAAVGPVQPINAELAVEVTYPEDENAIVAVQQVCGNLFSALLVPFLLRAGQYSIALPADSPLEKFTGDYVVLEAIAAIGVVYFATFNSPLLRTMMDSGEVKAAEGEAAKEL